MRNFQRERNVAGALVGKVDDQSVFVLVELEFASAEQAHAVNLANLVR
jgi:hypothetical protein